MPNVVLIVNVTMRFGYATGGKGLPLDEPIRLILAKADEIEIESHAVMPEVVLIVNQAMPKVVLIVNACRPYRERMSSLS